MSSRGPTHCPKCGEAADTHMRPCPFAVYEGGEHHLPAYRRWKGIGPVVEPAMMLAALDVAYAAMRR